MENFLEPNATSLIILISSFLISCFVLYLKSKRNYKKAHKTYIIDSLK